MRDASGGAPSAGTRDVVIGIVAGEASGDALAATLIAAVRQRLPRVRFVGVAGPKMEAAGCEAWVPLETLSVRGLVEVLGRVPDLVQLRRSLARRFVDAHIDAFIGVDAPDFNLGLERTLNPVQKSRAQAKARAAGLRFELNQGTAETAHDLKRRFTAVVQRGLLGGL